jgi:hypothetical protein
MSWSVAVGEEQGSRHVPPPLHGRPDHRHPGRPRGAGVTGRRGGVILLKALRPRPPAVALPTAQVGVLGFCGGVLDAIGGGGWGAVVTSTLIGHGGAPREAIGSASLAEFFVTAAVSATFVATVGLSLWPIIVGLVLGGVLAAPLAALAAKRLPARPLMAVVGLVVSLLAVRSLLASLGTPAGGR